MNLRSQPDARLARLASLMASRYQFLSRLGAGGSGTVYEVRNLSLDRREALKVLTGSPLDAKASERFAREARIAASLDHPGIVKIHSFGREEGIHWFSMTLVDGPTLGELAETGPVIDAAMLAGILMPLLEALEFSHGRGVIHRDIKPANILFDLQGHPYLTDFGIAKTEESALLTQTGMLMGTPAYVSPEQALGESVDARTDQYSLGITMYRALAGCLPFNSDNLLQTLVLRLNEEPVPLERHRPDLGPELSRVLMRSLARDRSDRWPGIPEMKAALAQVFASLELQPGPTPLLARLTPIARSPLPDLQETAPSRQAERGSFEPTAELALPESPARFGWYVAAVAMSAGVLGWAYLAWSRGAAATSAPPRLKVPGSAVTTPAAPPGGAPSGGTPLPHTPAAPAGSRVMDVPPGGGQERRAVVYPQLLEEAQALAAPCPPRCSGARVNVSLVVGEDGLVRRCRVLSPIAAECSEAAKALALRYRFKPALDAQGKPVEATVAVAVDFPEAP